MTRPLMSSAGASLLRALLSRAGIPLTFVGERHEMRFRIPGPNADATYRAIAGDLADSEFPIPRQILADIAVFGTPTRESDGSLCFCIEALTIEV
jgi:hypothetical protein